MPEPDRGTGIAQPGSWFYGILPYIEQQPLYDLGRGGGVQEVADANLKRNQTIISIFNCPSRRKNQLYPNFQGYRNCTFADRALRGDYAINGGDQPDCEIDPGPPDLVRGDNGTFLWRSNKKMTGIAYLRSEVRMSHITDGTSSTYLVGERYLNPNNYENGNDFADNSSMFSGFENETVRTTYSPPKPDTPGFDYIVQGSVGASTCSFGSAHPTVFQISFVDGSVRRSATTSTRKLTAAWATGRTARSSTPRSSDSSRGRESFSANPLTYQDSLWPKKTPEPLRVAR